MGSDEEGIWPSAMLLPGHWEPWEGADSPGFPPFRQAVRLESARPRRVRYLLLVRPEEAGAEAETALLGVDFAHEG